MVHFKDDLSLKFQEDFFADEKAIHYDFFSWTPIKLKNEQNMRFIVVGVNKNKKLIQEFSVEIDDLKDVMQSDFYFIGYTAK